MVSIVAYTFYSIASERSGIRLMDADWSDRWGWIVVQRSRRRLNCRERKANFGEIGGGVLYFVCLSAIEFLGADG